MFRLIDGCYTILCDYGLCAKRINTDATSMDEARAIAKNNLWGTTKGANGMTYDWCADHLKEVKK